MNPPQTIMSPIQSPNIEDIKARAPLLEMERKQMLYMIIRIGKSVCVLESEIVGQLREWKSLQRKITMNLDLRTMMQVNAHLINHRVERLDVQKLVYINNMDFKFKPTHKLASQLCHQPHCIMPILLFHLENPSSILRVSKLGYLRIVILRPLQVVRVKVLRLYGTLPLAQPTNTDACSSIEAF